MSGVRFVWASASAGLRPGERRALTLAFGLLLALLALTVANVVFGLGGGGSWVENWLSPAVYLVVAVIVSFRAARITADRGPWVLFAAALSLYALGNVLWSSWISRLPNPAIPSVSDGLWLSLYPLSYAGIIGLARRSKRRRLPAGVWLDGFIAGAGLAALGAAIVFGPVLASATGKPTAVATELAYPIGDFVLAALVVGVLALQGWKINRTWGLIVAGFVLLAIADCTYAVQVAEGSVSTPSMTNLLYFVAVGLLALAAWQPRTGDHHPQLTRLSTLPVPITFSVVALGLLCYDGFHRLDSLTVTLATITMVASLLRTGLAFRDLRSLAEARALAMTDDLTSLPNRRHFILACDAAIVAARTADRAVPVMLLDLSHFRQLNDTLGHDAGDILLRLIGPRLERAMRGDDTVARLGGDEFAILLDPPPVPADIPPIAEKILNALREPFAVRGVSIRITANLGIACFPQDGDDSEALMKHAEVAMYRAKNSQGGYELYAAGTDTNSPARLQIAAELATALAGDGIIVQFQPKAEAHSRRIVGVEALVRMRNPDGSMMAPLEFLAAAEHSGQSRALTRKVVGTALDQVATWRRAGHELDVAVNTTVADLLDVSFPQEIAQALEDRGLPARALILEVTETSIIADPERTGDVLARLGELGIGLSLDDFGTGYSSLMHLRTLPVGEVKIDRSFIAGLRADARDAAIVYSTIELSHKLGMRVVAEGVEDEATWKSLEAAGCELIQGYFLSPPVSAAEAGQLLDTATAQRPSEAPLAPIMPVLLVTTPD